MICEQEGLQLGAFAEQLKEFGKILQRARGWDVRGWNAETLGQGLAWGSYVEGVARGIPDAQRRAFEEALQQAGCESRASRVELLMEARWQLLDSILDSFGLPGHRSRQDLVASVVASAEGADGAEGGRRRAAIRALRCWPSRRQVHLEGALDARASSTLRLSRSCQRRATWVAKAAILWTVLGLQTLRGTHRKIPASLAQSLEAPGKRLRFSCPEAGEEQTRCASCPQRMPPRRLRGSGRNHCSRCHLRLSRRHVRGKAYARAVLRVLESKTREARTEFVSSFFRAVEGLAARDAVDIVLWTLVLACSRRSAPLGAPIADVLARSKSLMDACFQGADSGLLVDAACASETFRDALVAFLLVDMSQRSRRVCAQQEELWRGTSNCLGREARICAELSQAAAPVSTVLVSSIKGAGLEELVDEVLREEMLPTGC